MRIIRTAFVLVVLAAAVPTGAEAAPDGMISGFVRDVAGVPLEGICVSASTPGGSGGFARTRGNGGYLIRGLLPGAYNVVFEDCLQGRYYEQRYGGDDPIAALVVVGLGNTHGIDAVMELPGSITGHVRNAEGDGVWGCVTVHDAEGSLVGTASDYVGEYRINGLETGAYVVRYRDCHLQGWVNTYHPDAMDEANAVPVEVTFGETTPDVDILVRRTGTVSGTVTDTEGRPAAVCVEARNPDAPYGYVSTGTDEQGAYTLIRVQPQVVIAFSDCDDLIEYYDDAPDLSSATIVQVPPETDVSGIDAVI